jgi:hypothetical protein
MRLGLQTAIQNWVKKEEVNKKISRNIRLISIP